eukprot:scaffold249315_cov39-Cyclotella_meneghiniana.AAC.7
MSRGLRLSLSRLAVMVQVEVGSSVEPLREPPSRKKEVRSGMLTTKRVWHDVTSLSRTLVSAIHSKSTPPLTIVTNEANDKQ